MKDWNPRYVAYAECHGRAPADMLKYDRERWPGGCMCGFILWMMKMKVAFKETSPRSFLGDVIYDQKAWTEFLIKAAKDPATERVE